MQFATRSGTTTNARPLCAGTAASQTRCRAPTTSPWTWPTTLTWCRVRRPLHGSCTAAAQRRARDTSLLGLTLASKLFRVTPGLGGLRLAAGTSTGAIVATYLATKGGFTQEHILRHDKYKQQVDAFVKCKRQAIEQQQVDATVKARKVNALPAAVAQPGAR